MRGDVNRRGLLYASASGSGSRMCMRKIYKHKSHVSHVILVRASLSHMQADSETIILSYRNTVSKFRGNPSVHQVSKADLRDHDH